MTQVGHAADVPAETVAEAPGVAIRWLIAQKAGARNFAMRVIEVQPGAATPWHSHGTEHEAFVLDGEGVLRTLEGETPLAEDDYGFVSPGIWHQFINRGSGLFRFICVVTMPDEPH